MYVCMLGGDLFLFGLVNCDQSVKDDDEEEGDDNDTLLLLQEIDYYRGMPNPPLASGGIGFQHKSCKDLFAICEKVCG